MPRANRPTGSAGKARSSLQSKQHVKGENFYRQDAKKLKHISMLANGHRATRDKDGKIIQEAEFQSKDAPIGRVQADRRWFGNTRVISQDALTYFRDSLAAKQADPFSVILKQNKLPMSLLQEATKAARVKLETAEPFSDTFGPRAQRKRPRVDVGSFEELAKSSQANNKRTHAQMTAEDGGADAISGETAAQAQSGDGANGTDDHDVGADHLNDEQRILEADAELANAPKDYILQAGTSRRIWGELYKVIDSSDIILHVLDARDPLGTRCHSVENYLAKEKRAKKVIYILNKVDLIPGWAAARWVQHLSKTHPTIAFHASINNSFGKGSLIQLLRQFSNLMSDKKQISVGFVGYPNVGKSSIINTIKNKKVCNVAPIPGETKVWQYITLMRRIYLIDCPGIVPPSSKETETQKILKGVVRVEHLSAPGDSIPTLLSRVRKEYIQRTYGVQDWENAEDFLSQLAQKRGKLGKGGEANTDTVAKMVLNDWIRGRIPYFVRPPDMGQPSQKAKNDEPAASTAEEAVTAASDSKAFGEGRVAGVVQPLHQIVSRQKFIQEDQDIGDDGEEWGGINTTINADAEVVDDDLGSADGVEEIEGASDGSDAGSIDERDDAEIDSAEEAELTWDDLVNDGKPTAAAKPVTQADDSGDEADSRRRKPKEERMKTNKKKAESFYTHANVKNRNRNRKVPKADNGKARKKR